MLFKNRNVNSEINYLGTMKFNGHCPLNLCSGLDMEFL